MQGHHAEFVAMSRSSIPEAVVSDELERVFLLLLKTSRFRDLAWETMPFCKKMAQLRRAVLSESMSRAQSVVWANRGEQARPAALTRKHLGRVTFPAGLRSLHMATEPPMWRRQLTQLLGMLPSGLVELHVTVQEQGTSVLHDILTRLPNLESLSLVYRVCASGPIQIVDFPEQLSRLKCLSLTCDHSSEDWERPVVGSCQWTDASRLEHVGVEFDDEESRLTNLLPDESFRDRWSHLTYREFCDTRDQRIRLLADFGDGDSERDVLDYLLWDLEDRLEKYHLGRCEVENDV
jgi:hypothetical protein